MITGSDIVVNNMSVSDYNLEFTEIDIRRDSSSYPFEDRFREGSNFLDMG